MKKIMMLSPRFVSTISGVETYLSALMNYLQADYEVHLITRKENCLRDDAGALHIHYVEGFNSLHIDLYKALPEMNRIFRSVQPDLVHIHCCMSLFLYKALIPPGKYPLVVTMHSTPDGNSRLFGWFQDYQTEIDFCRTLFDHLSAEAVIFGSNYYKVQYTGCAPEMLQAKRLCINEYFSDLPGISLADYDKKYENGTLQQRNYKILFPSRIMKRKGIEESLYLLRLLPDNFEMDIPAFAHIENREYTEHIKMMIRRLGLEKRVCLPSGIVFPSEMDAYYKKADIVLIPSHYEGFGIVAVEAMDYCVPVFTTCAGGLAEIIEDGYNGIQIQLNCLERVAEQIQEVIHDHSLRDRIVRNGKKTVQSKFSKKRHMSMIEKIYKEAIHS